MFIRTDDPQAPDHGQGPTLAAAMNGEPIIDMDLVQWAEQGKNPDATKNKFKKKLKDFKREGHAGLQDHGAEVEFWNVRIKPLQ